MNTKTKRVFAAIGGVVLIGGLAACGSGNDTSSESPSAQVTTASESPSPTGNVQLKFDTNLSSIYKNLRQVGDDNQHTYGWNMFSGSAKIDTGDDETRNATITLQGSVNYDGDHGPFTGFVTITFSTNNKLAFYIGDGEANNPSENHTNFKGNAAIIGGSGPWNGATGTGTFEGKRTGALGSPVKATIELDITAPKQDGASQSGSADLSNEASVSGGASESSDPSTENSDQGGQQ